jgi:hypothetical protein
MSIEADRYLEVTLYSGAEEIEHFSCSNEAKAIGYSMYLGATAMSICDHSDGNVKHFITNPLTSRLGICNEEAFMRSIQQNDLTLV